MDCAPPSQLVKWEAGISEENVTQECAEEPESPPLKPDFFFSGFQKPSPKKRHVISRR